MQKTLSVLIVIDTEGALASGSAIGNAYLVDTNGFLGSWQEGTDSLNTICQDGQIVVWSAMPVSPGGDVSIAGFSGAMVSSGVCTPAAEGGPGQQFWSGKVEAQGAVTPFDYAVAVSIGGSQMSLNSVLKVM